ncbi:MAG: lipoprotein N-acyltransferase Lnb domain-containing protein [Lutibacter sp.]
MKSKIILLLTFFEVFISTISAQQLSDKATVSVLTCGPGTELYSAFGHSAFRVKDPINHIDKVYNYGTFDFNAPHFYLNFAKGKLTYQLATSSFNWFIRVYRYENRWVKAQVLNLTNKEVQKVYDFLENNAKPKNKYYQYDFFYNNCSTKILDVLNNCLSGKVKYSYNYITELKTHRDLIKENTQTFKWAQFGIDLALGSVIDKKVKKNEFNFLPNYLFKTIDNATIINDSKPFPLVKEEHEVINNIKIKDNQSIFLSPYFVLFVFSMGLFLLIFITSKKNRRLKGIDFLIYFITGFIGVIVLLLWFATSHTATYRNFNFLWAFAPNIIISFLLLKNTLPKWLINYNKLLLILIALLLLLMSFKIQRINVALIPIFLFLIWYYNNLIKTIKKHS